MKLRIFSTLIICWLMSSFKVSAQCPEFSFTTTDLGGGLYSFTLVQNNGSNGTLVNATWYFNDGTPNVQSSAMTMQHQFATAGNYAVSIAYTASYPIVLETGTTQRLCDYKWGGPAIQYAGSECPKLVFLPFSNDCGEGEVGFQLAECNPTNAQLQQVVWTLGNGSTETTSDLHLDYVYTATNMYSVFATATYILPNGQTCTVQAGKPNSDDPNPLSEYCAVTTVADHLQVPIILFSGSIAFAAPNTIPTAGSASIVLNYSGSIPSNSPYTISLDGVVVTTGNSIPASGNVLATINLPEGQHLIEVDIESPKRFCTLHIQKWIEVLPPPPPPCEECFTFQPEVGKRYWISAWAKEEHASQVMNYINATIQVEFIGSTASSVVFHTSDEIIEGWQRIVGDFTIPTGTTSISINLLNPNSNVAAYFDDIRVHPFNASMKSYIYDPVSFLLTAELDDNNYATFYEYDKEGLLIRIKKETSRGVMTISESHTNEVKK